MLRPIGAGITKSDVGRVRKLARAQDVRVAVATDGLQLVAVENGTILEIDLREIGRKQSQFDLLTSFALDPSLFEAVK